jgi:uncharacterized membrane protein YkvA (DUF1232 family)
MKLSIQSIYQCYRNAIRNPKYRWWIIIGTLVYLLNPFDILPEVFPIVGEIDDAAVLVLLISEVSQVLFESLKSRQNPPVSSESTTIDVDAVSVD